MKRLINYIAFMLLLLTHVANAHESRPVFVNIQQIHPSQFLVNIKTPQGGLLKGQLYPVFSKTCQVKNNTPQRHFGFAALSSQVLACQNGLRGSTISFHDLDKNLGLSVLLRIQFLNGSTFSHILLPTNPSVEIPQLPSKWSVFIAYTKLGIKHILEGIDHLLFILCLLLIVSNVKQLIWTITGFTLAHSITLSLATLNILRLPIAFVETCIALSIVFLAAEVYKNQKDSLIFRKPVLIAFSFGLLHGFGFADVLLSLGLPQSEILLGLFSFNLGVEIGQLLFIAAFFAIVLLASLFNYRRPLISHKIMALCIGSIAAFWTLERFSGIIT